MRQETKEFQKKNKSKLTVMLAVHDTECEFLKICSLISSFTSLSLSGNDIISGTILTRLVPLRGRRRIIPRRRRYFLRWLLGLCRLTMMKGISPLLEA
jgi:hypothetical protein